MLWTCSLKSYPKCQWRIALFSIRLSDPRAWTAHLGMRTQGKAKFVSSVRRIIVHEYYNSRNYDYDIALLQLSIPWPDTMRHVIQPVCIPPLSHKAHGGEKCWVTGWGQRQEAGEPYLALYISSSISVLLSKVAVALHLTCI